MDDDHIMNNRLSLEFGQSFLRIPLAISPHIRRGDALEIDWEEVLPPQQCDYILGNPPYGGSKYQTNEQRAQVRAIARLGGSGGTLDYVAAWFLKAGVYVQRGSAAIGYVATNSITQGEQVAQLWPLLFDRYRLELAFAHRTFAWGSDARGKAHVHVVIIGLTRHDREPSVKRLFSYDDVESDPTESRHQALTPYLFDAGTVVNRHLVVKETASPLSSGPKMIIGSKPIDGGYLIFGDASERADFLLKEPTARKFMLPFVGTDQYLNGGQRWILALQSASPSELRAMPLVSKRLKAVHDYRLGLIVAKKRRNKEPKLPGISARALADTPCEFHVTVIPASPFLAVPEVSSERREYIPTGWLSPPTIPSNKLRFIKDADLWHFGVLTSRMHMAWMRHIGGRLESRYQYSIGVVYNTFPWPKASTAQCQEIRRLAQAVIDARALFPGSTLADLYDATVMKPELRRAHNSLDRAVDRLYRSMRFGSDRERVEHLFGLYESLVAPLTHTPAPLRRRGRTQALDTQITGAPR